MKINIRGIDKRHGQRDREVVMMNELVGAAEVLDARETGMDELAKFVKSMDHCWIRVTDPETGELNLPPLATNVLLLVNGTIYEGALTQYKAGWDELGGDYMYFIDVDEQYPDWEWQSITHWMHIPELPPEHEYRPHDDKYFQG